MAEIFKLSNRKIKEVQDELKDLKEALYGYVLDTAQIETTGAIPQTVTIGSGTYNLVDDVRGFVSEVKGNTVKFGNFLKSVNYEGLKVSGANLLNIADKASTTTNGITYSISNGVITINGTATQNMDIGTYVINLPNGNYTYKLFNDKIKPFIWYDSTNWVQKGLGESITFTNKLYAIRIDIPNGTTFNNETIKPLLVRGSTAPTTFKPYKEPVTILPFNATTLRGANEVKDKIVITKNTSDDYYTATKVTNVGFEFLGSLNWSYSEWGSSMAFSSQLPLAKVTNPSNKANAICVLFEIASADDTYTNASDNILSIHGEDKDLHIICSNYTDAATFKSAMGAVLFHYELETPTTTVLSATLTEADVMPLLELGGSVEVLNNNAAYAQGSTVIEMVYKLINTDTASVAVQSEEEPTNE